MLQDGTCGAPPKFMTPEISNYCRRCLNPIFAISAAARLASRASWSVFRRIWPDSRHLFQPQPIRRLRHNLSRTVAVHTHPHQLESPPVCSLTLAVGSFDIDLDSDWRREFPDSEITLSLHRWNWLLRGLTDNRPLLSNSCGLRLMRSWLTGCQSNHALARDAYSTGERIVNGSLFLLLTSDGVIPPDITAAFRVMCRHVADHVEYYPFGQTGNHAFNNARALLFAGFVAQLPVAVDLAYEISKERLPSLVSTDGFMREGSSHYHFLFTRWVLEMLWLADRMNNLPFVRLLTPYARVLVRRCWFFLVQSEANRGWQIPLMGDVSPDFPPEWLLGLPWSSLACALYKPDELPSPPQQRGWSDLFGRIDGSAASVLWHTAGFPSSGWFRIDHHPWTAFIRAPSTDGRIRAGHEHHDLGAVVLFRNGAPLLIDSGRLDYTASVLGRYGKSALAHNSLLVDGMGPTVEGPSWCSGPYSAVRADVDVDREGEDAVITVRHNGFGRRARGRILHHRRLRLSRVGCWIEDQLNGEGLHRVQIRFHFAPGTDVGSDSHRGWRLGESGLRFQPSPLSDAVVQRGQTVEPVGGLFFPAYGQQQVSDTLDLSDTVRLPAALTHAILDES